MVKPAHQEKLRMHNAPFQDGDDAALVRVGDGHQLARQPGVVLVVQIVIEVQLFR